MTVKEISDSIYNFDGTPEEWLGFEKEIMSDIENFSDEENEELIESECMEHLTMICEGIRFERRKLHSKQ